MQLSGSSPSTSAHIFRWPVPTHISPHSSQCSGSISSVASTGSIQKRMDLCSIVLLLFLRFSLVFNLLHISSSGSILGFGPLKCVKIITMECKREENIEKCNCTYSGCPRKGICCKCLEYHKGRGELPACYFSPQAEATYERSIEKFNQDRRACG